MRSLLPWEARHWVGLVSFCLLSLVSGCRVWGGTGEQGQELRFVVYGGSEETGEQAQAVVAQTARLRPHLVAHAGGMIGQDGITHWRAFRQLVDPLLAICPFYGPRGRGESGPFVAARNGSPDPVLRGHHYYSVDYRGAHFVFLDTELRLERGDPQTEWLGEDLAAAAGKPTFVFSHRAVFGAAERFILPRADYWWHPLFVKHKVRIAFSGGRHLYHRLSRDGVTYVVTGGGGAPLNPVMARRQICPGDVAGSFNHCIEVTLADGEIRCRTIDTEGRTRDEFVVPAAPPR